jgi:hypothetical protein
LLELVQLNIDQISKPNLKDIYLVEYNLLNEFSVAKNNASYSETGYSVSLERYDYIVAFVIVVASPVPQAILIVSFSSADLDHSDQFPLVYRVKQNQDRILIIFVPIPEPTVKYGLTQQYIIY